MAINRINGAVQPAAKNVTRKRKFDYTLALLRLFLLLLIVIIHSVFLSVKTQFNLQEFASFITLIIFLAELFVIITIFSIRKSYEWERVITLRLGKFHKVRGPGIYFLIPLVDHVYRIIDIRIRVTDFYAQETLTGDSVTVKVDAFCFWLVWDPQKAALEIEDYEEAVTLASKAALRNVISKNDLSTFLTHGDIIEKQIQEEVERQTTEWGITVQYVEITDVQIPQELQNSLSRAAQADREKKGRILLAEAEIEIARKLDEAVEIYTKNENAMKLKILSILNEGLKAGSSMMLVPNTITEELKTKDIFGLQALNEIKKQEGEKNDSSKSSKCS